MIKTLETDVGRESVKEAQRTRHAYGEIRFVVSLPREYYVKEMTVRSQPEPKEANDE